MGFMDSFKNFFNANENKVEEQISSVQSDETVEQNTVSTGIAGNHNETINEDKKKSSNVKDNSFHLTLPFPDRKVGILNNYNYNDTSREFYYDLDDYYNDSQEIKLQNKKSNTIDFSLDNVSNLKTEYDNLHGFSEKQINSITFSKKIEPSVYLNVTLDDLSDEPKASFVLKFGNESLTLVPQSFLNDDILAENLNQVIQSAEQEARFIAKEEILEPSFDIPKKYFNQCKLDKDEFILSLYDLEKPTIMLKGFCGVEENKDVIHIVYPKTLDEDKEVNIAREWLHSSEREVYSKVLESLDEKNDAVVLVPKHLLRISDSMREILSDFERDVMIQSRENPSFWDKPSDELKAGRIIAHDVDLEFKTHQNVNRIGFISGKCKFQVLRAYAKRIRSSSAGMTGKTVEFSFDGVLGNEKPEISVTLYNDETLKFNNLTFSEFTDVLHHLDYSSKFDDFVRSKLTHDVETTISAEDSKYLKYAVNEKGRGVLVFPELNDSFKARILCNNIQKEEDGSLKLNVPLLPPQSVNVKGKFLDLAVCNIKDLNKIVSENRNKFENSKDKSNLKLVEKNREKEELTKGMV